MSDNLLILGAGRMQIPIIKRANDFGFKTIVVDYDENAPGLKYASKYYKVSTLDKENVLKIATIEKIKGILTTSDAPVRVVAYVAEQLGLPGMSGKVSEICTNKYIQRRLCSNNGINCPKYQLCDMESNLDAYNDFPYIVKPIDSSASRGVTKVNNKDELISAAKEALNYSKEKKIILESFIDGREFSVEALTQHKDTYIIAITEKLTRGEDQGYFVEDTHIEPARISDHEKQLIINEVTKVIKLIGIDNCPTHTEIKINDKGAYIIEIACRLGGDYITSDLVPLSTGVDMLGNLINLSIGRDIDVARKVSATSAVQFLNPDNYDRCKNYIASHPEAMFRHEIEPYENAIIKNSLGRLGYIIIQCKDISKLENELNKIV